MKLSFSSGHGAARLTTDPCRLRLGIPAAILFAATAHAQEEEPPALPEAPPFERRVADDDPGPPAC